MFVFSPFGKASDDRCGAALSCAVGAAPPSESPVSGAGRGLKLHQRRRVLIESFSKMWRKMQRVFPFLHQYVEFIKKLWSLQCDLVVTSPSHVLPAAWHLWLSRSCHSGAVATLQSQSWHFRSTPVAIFVRERVQLLVLCWGLFVVGCCCWFFNLL